MGRVRELSITLDGSKDVFFAGGFINGYFTVNYDQEQLLRSIRLRIIGEINCVWTEFGNSSSHSDSALLVPYMSYECILDNTIFLLKNNDTKSNETFLHHPGQQTYDFSYELGRDLPSSFEGSHGSVRYFLKLTVEEINGEYYHSKYAFTFLAYIDVNKKSYIQPKGEMSNISGLSCCPTGLIHIKASLDRPAYCPGESILATIAVKNSTKNPIPSMCIQLEKMEICKGIRVGDDSQEFEEKIRKTYISSVRSVGISAKDSCNIKDQVLNVPVTEPTFKAGLISVCYYVHVFLQVHKNPNLRLLIPITIGTVPFHGGSVESNLSLKSEGKPLEFLPVDGARGLRIKEDDDGEYIFVTDDFIPLYPFVKS